jgi:integrase
MNTQDGTPARRERVERNIYKRADGKFEVGFRDSTGRQRWRVVQGGITAARNERDAILGDKGRGKHVQPNPRLTFGEAADKWLADQVAELRRTTQANYRNSIENHLRPRWGRRRLDSITVDEVARLVRELRAEGKAEASIASVLAAATRTFKFARRRMAWHGEIPTGQLEGNERPKVTQAAKQRIFRGDELAQTLAAAAEPWRTLFSFAAVTGARISKCLGLVWSDHRHVLGPGGR